MKRKISIHIIRHAECNYETGQLTEEGKMKVRKLRENMIEHFDEAITPMIDRHIDTADMLCGHSISNLSLNKINDFKKGDSIAQIFSVLIDNVFKIVNKEFKNKNSVRVLVVLSSNIISAFKQLGQPLPDNLDKLPLIPNLEGLEIDFFL